MLKIKTPYNDIGADANDEKRRTCTIKSLERKARKLGLQLSASPS